MLNPNHTSAFRLLGAIDFKELLTSVYAMIIYVVIILAIMIALVFSLMTKEDRAPLTVQLAQDPSAINQPPVIMQVGNGSHAVSNTQATDEAGFFNPNSHASFTHGTFNPNQYINKVDERDAPAIKDPASSPIKEQDEQGGQDEGENQEEKKTNDKRFYKLCIIDETKDTYVRDDYDDEITLYQLCERFRNFSASRLGLYYDISDIRRFIAGLGVSHIMILQGISGTGKTSLAYAFGKFLDNSSAVVSVQPMWKERTDLVGYYNEFTKTFNETLLLEKLYEAIYSKDIFITILDEMNIARIEYYFAEFLSLLELPNPDERLIPVVTNKWATDPVMLNDGKIKLAPNMWFIGTANNDDSTFSISDKVYDRAMVINLDFQAQPFYAPKTDGVHLSAKRFERLIEDAKKEYAVTRRNQKRLQVLAGLLYKYFRIGFGNRIRKQILHYIPIYLACGGDELDALDDILARKVMRKLEMQNTVYIKNSAEPFCEELEELFGEGKMRQCTEFISHLVGRR